MPAANRLVVQIRRTPAPVLVTILGEIDLATVPDLRDAITGLPEDDVIVDAAGVTFLAVAGVRALLDLHRRQQRSGARVIIACAPEPTRRLLNLTRCDAALPVCDTIEAAAVLLKSVPSRPPTDG
jgi:anti-sigma B factor antagonist